MISFTFSNDDYFREHGAHPRGENTWTFKVYVTVPHPSGFREGRDLPDTILSRGTIHAARLDAKAKALEMLPAEADGACLITLPF